MSKLVLFPAIPWAGVQLRHSSPARGARKKLAEKLGFRRSGWISFFEVDCKLERTSRVRNRWLALLFPSIFFSFLHLFFLFATVVTVGIPEAPHLFWLKWWQSEWTRSYSDLEMAPMVVKDEVFLLVLGGVVVQTRKHEETSERRKTRPRCFKDTKDMYLLNSFDVKEMEQNIQNKEKHWKTRSFSFGWKPPGLAPKATARRFMDQCFLVPSPHKMFPLPGLWLGLVSQSLQYFNKLISLTQPH